MKQLFWTVVLLLFTVFSASAKITGITIIKAEDYNNGKAYGNAGAYERLYGQATGAVNPTDPLNAVIQDILLAPRNASGLVEYTSNFIILKPKDMTKCNGILFLSLPNRGNAFAPDTGLLKRGYVYFWCAWQGDLLPGGNRLLMKVPVATDNGKTITGLVRSELSTWDNQPTLPLSAGTFTGNSHHSYPVVAGTENTATLTRRVHEADERVPVPKNDWAFADCRQTAFPGTPSDSLISIKGGFDPNYIYELIYTAKDPLVLGLGFASIRDFSSFLKYETTAPDGSRNPLLGAGNNKYVKATVMQGVSQCGNFTRIYLQLGFNQDEQHRQVFDGVNSHVATRRVALNVRFGRPGGGGMQREDHLYPGNDAPFNWEVETDPISGIRGGLLEACLNTNTCPRIIHTLSATEYWQMRASMRTTNVEGTRDVAIPPQVRIYMFNGTQHGPSGVATMDKASGFLNNDNNFQLYWRAALVGLERWILNNQPPAPSIYPKVANNTLVKPAKNTSGWPGIPGVPYSGLVNNGAPIDFGKDFYPKKMSGIVSEPPRVISGKAYRSLVPKMDADGNELGGLRSVKLRVPLGTYTGWSIRREGFGAGDLASLTGMYIPFKKTKAERLAAGDPRLSLEERYKSKADYLAKIKQAANKLVKDRYLLQEDVPAVMMEAEKGTVLN